MKKSFKDLNPALQFINSGDSSKTVDNYTHTDEDIYTHTDVYTDTHTHTYTHILVPQRKELKSKRIQLLIRPRTHELLNKAAKEHSTSVNDIINTILEGYLDANGYK